MGTYKSKYSGVEIDQILNNAQSDHMDVADNKSQISGLNQALADTKKDLQHQINTLVLESGGDSNLEVVGARADISGKMHPTLNDRLEVDFDKKVDKPTVEALQSQVSTNTTKTVDLQSQIDSLVLEAGGDSNPEVVQARTDETGTTHATLKERIDSSVTDLKSDLVEYTNVNGIVYIPTNVTEYNNKYIDDYGVLQTLSKYKVISNIELKKDEVITVETHSENHVSIISKVDNGTYIPLVKSTLDSSYKKVNYTADEDCVIAISVRYTNNYLYYLIKANVKNIENKTNECFSALSNSYKDINGELKGSIQAQKTSKNKVVLAGASNSYNVYEAPITENDYIRVDCQVGPNENYAVGFFCCDDDYNILYQFNYPINTRLQYEFVAPKGSKKIVVNGYRFIPYAKEIVKVAPPITYTSLSLFEKFGVIGDSFASGLLYYDNDYHHHYNTSWGQIMARKLGTTCVNFSKGGLSTRTWLTDAKGLSSVLSNDPQDIYYCALGINDVYALGIDYLGAISDITDFTSYVDYRDTFYGNYGKIIEQVQNHAPYSKIVLFTCANNDGNYELFNNAIIEIANHYNIPYIVQGEDPFFNTDIYLKMEGSHPTAIGYSGMAEAFERLLNKCIVDNLNYFKNTFMYNNQ